MHGASMFMPRYTEDVDDPAAVTTGRIHKPRPRRAN